MKQDIGSYIENKFGDPPSPHTIQFLGGQGGGGFWVPKHYLSPMKQNIGIYIENKFEGNSSTCIKFVIYCLIDFYTRSEK